MKSLHVFLAAAVAFVASCAGTGKNMQPAGGVITAVTKDQAGVVFIRPSPGASGVRSIIFELVEGAPPMLVGVLPARRKLFYRTIPGAHLFMVIGEKDEDKPPFGIIPEAHKRIALGDSVDFMPADLVPGAIFYAKAAVRRGLANLSFSLRPLSPEEPRVDGWLAATEWVVRSEEAARWARENAKAIEEKKDEYLPKWRAEPPSDRPELGSD